VVAGTVPNKLANAPVEGEVIDRTPDQLTKIVEQNRLPQVDATLLISSFSPFFAQADELIRASQSIVVTDATQVSLIRKAREARLALRQVRISAEHARKTLKEDSHRRSKAIDGINNVLLLAIEPEEKRLEEAEKFAERAEAKRKAELRDARTAELAPFGVDGKFYQLDEMPDAQYATLLENSRNAHENKLAAEKRAAEDRAAADRKAQEEAARLAAENERLRKEKDAADAAAREERAKADATARAEREAAQKLARRRETLVRHGLDPELFNLNQMTDEQLDEITAQVRAELARKEAELEAERERLEQAAAELAERKAQEAARERAAERQRKRLALAPDQDKIAAWAKQLKAVPRPEVETAEAIAAVEEIDAFLTTVFGRITKKAEMLGGAA
jgi:hypothetical protein